MTVPAGIAPSILSADFARLGEQVGLVLGAGARTIHVDVMDGHFVPPITMGPIVVEALREQVHAAGAILDVHLMVERPERHVAAFAEAGADRILAQIEATPNIHYAISAIRDAGCSPGVVINPGTPVEAVADLAADVDVVLCMTVDPGWGGQAFLPSSPAKIARLAALLDGAAVIEVDGGVDARSAGACVEAGASVLVAGSAVFGAEDPAAALREIAAAGGSGSRIGGGWAMGDDRPAMPTTVLIVDDHPSFRATARRLLELEGYDVVGEAADGAQAITQARALTPDLVLLDVNLPDGDGFDVAADLTAVADGPAVVMTSSRDGSDFGPLVAGSGARGFIAKADLSGAALQQLVTR